jgi:hypothetical protein
MLKITSSGVESVIPDKKNGGACDRSRPRHRFVKPRSNESLTPQHLPLWHQVPDLGIAPSVRSTTGKNGVSRT